MVHAVMVTLPCCVICSKHHLSRPTTKWKFPGSRHGSLGLGELASLTVGKDRSLFGKVQNLCKPLTDSFPVASCANIGLASVTTSLNRPRVMLVLKALFLEKGKDKPLFSFMDEAHTLDPDMAMVLLHASGDIRVDGGLFLPRAGRHSNPRDSIMQRQCYVLESK